MNPVTQKSLIVNHSTKWGDTSSSFDRDSSIDSDRTSVMDAQFKPHVQLKFAFISWFVYLIVCSLAASLTLVSSSSLPDPILHRLFSFLYLAITFIYALMQLIFYVISRDDVFQNTESRSWVGLFKRSDDQLEDDH